MLVGLRDRGLDVTRPILVVIDGAKALRRAVTEVFDHPVIQRCQLHKLRNVTDRLPDAVASTVAKRMRRAYHHPRPADRPGRVGGAGTGAGPLPPGRRRQPAGGLAETLTISRLGVPPTLARTLRRTNSIESMIEICRDHAANVKRWQDGQMVLRWIAAGMGEAAASSAASTATCTCPRCASPSTRPSLLSHQPRRMPPDQPLTAAEVPRRAGQPRRPAQPSALVRKGDGHHHHRIPEPSRVTVGVDTHGQVHVACALDQLGRQLATRQAATTPAGYRALLDWARSLGEVQAWGVEGTGCYGAGLARFLAGQGQQVWEVNRPDRRPPPAGQVRSGRC